MLWTDNVRVGDILRRVGVTAGTDGGWLAERALGKTADRGGIGPGSMRGGRRDADKGGRMVDQATRTDELGRQTARLSRLLAEAACDKATPNKAALGSTGPLMDSAVPAPEGSGTRHQETRLSGYGGERCRSGQPLVIT